MPTQYLGAYNGKKEVKDAFLAGFSLRQAFAYRKYGITGAVFNCIRVVSSATPNSPRKGYPLIPRLSRVFFEAIPIGADLLRLDVPENPERMLATKLAQWQSEAIQSFRADLLRHHDVRANVHAYLDTQLADLRERFCTKLFQAPQLQKRAA